MSAADAVTYDLVVASIDSRLGDGNPWATRDAPEIYYLTGRRNPTRVLCEFLEPDEADPGRAARPPGGQGGS